MSTLESDSPTLGAPGGHTPRAPRRTALPRRALVASAPGYVFALPTVAFVAIFFLYPLGKMAFDTLVLRDGSVWQVDFGPFGDILSSPYERAVLLRTVRIAVVSTVLCLVIALPLALWMRDLPPKAKPYVTALLVSPLLTSAVVRSLGWISILGSGGLIDQAAQGVGAGPVNMMYTETAVVIGLVQDFVGIVTITLAGSVQKIPNNVIWASRDLGANGWTTFRHVVWPTTLPGVIAGVSIAFPLCMGAYVAPALLGGNDNRMVGNEVYTQAILFLQFDRASALAIMLFAAICIASLGLSLSTRLSRRGLHA